MPRCHADFGQYFVSQKCGFGRKMTRSADGELFLKSEREISCLVITSPSESHVARPQRPIDTYISRYGHRHRHYRAWHFGAARRAERGRLVYIRYAASLYFIERQSAPRAGLAG